jgi:hypothetical protein
MKFPSISTSPLSYIYRQLKCSFVFLCVHIKEAGMRGMAIEDEIVAIILRDSLFNSALASWMQENAVDQEGALYALLAHDERTRREIAYEAVYHCAKYVGSKANWKRDIATDALLGNHLKSMFAGLLMLSEVSIDGGALPSAAEAWRQWQLHSAGQGASASIWNCTCNAGGARVQVHNEIGDIHARLDALKHLGGSYSASAFLYTYSCDVRVKNYTTHLIPYPRDFWATAKWNAKDNLSDVLKGIAGDDFYWRVSYTGGDGTKYDSFACLQENVEDDLRKEEYRDGVTLYIRFAA